MGNDLIPRSLDTSLDTARAAVVDFIAASQAPNTRRAYASDWRQFERWCLLTSVNALPAAPETIASYLASLATDGRRKFATLRRRCAAIAWTHRRAGLESPVSHVGVKQTLEGIARSLGSAPLKKAALTAELLAKAVRKLPADVPGLRDRALLLLGFAGAFRRSELVALDVRDIARHPRGLVITLVRSKTDQLGAGTTKTIPRGKRLNVAEALDAWLIAARIVEGAVFRGVRGPTVLGQRLSAQQVTAIVKKRCAAIGLDASLFAGHSLRSGFITSAASHGAKLAAIADHAGHAKLDTTRGYMQIADAFADHPGKRFL